MNITSSIPDLKREGTAALHHYHHMSYTSKELESVFLSIFETIKGGLESSYGKHKLTIVKFSNDGHDFNLLPEELNIYRGYREPEKRMGISWSLSRQIAEGFAFDATLPDDHKRRIATINGVDYYPARSYTVEEAAKLTPCLVTGKCKLVDVLAYTNNRQEQEIILNPKSVSDVRDITPSNATLAKVEAIHLAVAQKKNRHAVERIRAEPIEWLLENKQH